MGNCRTDNYVAIDTFIVCLSFSSEKNVMDNTVKLKTIMMLNGVLLCAFFSWFYCCYYLQQDHLISFPFMYNKWHVLE